MPKGGDQRSKSPTLKKKRTSPARSRAPRSKRRSRPEPRGRGQPKLPLHLTAAERLEFAHVLETAPASLLTGADQALIENYAVAICAAREAHGKLQTGKLTRRRLHHRPCQAAFPCDPHRAPDRL